MVIFQEIDTNKLVKSSRGFVEASGSNPYKTEAYIGHMFNALSRRIAERTEWKTLETKVYPGENGSINFWACESKVGCAVSFMFEPRATGKSVVVVTAREHTPRVFTQLPERNGVFSAKQIRQMVSMVNEMAGKGCAL